MFEKDVGERMRKNGKECARAREGERERERERQRNSRIGVILRARSHAYPAKTVPLLLQLLEIFRFRFDPRLSFLLEGREGGLKFRNSLRRILQTPATEFDDDGIYAQRYN